MELGGLTTADSGFYALNGNGYLAANAEFIGYAGSGTFTQTGGTNAVSNIYLINGSGLYNLNGGMLTAATITLGASGTFVQSGGFVTSGVLQNGGTFDYSGGQFNGQPELYNGTVNFGAAFYAAGGIVNNATLVVLAGITVGTSSGGSTLDNEAIDISRRRHIGRRWCVYWRRRPDRQQWLRFPALAGLQAAFGIINNAQIVQTRAATVDHRRGNRRHVQREHDLAPVGLPASAQRKYARQHGGVIDLNFSTIAGSGLLE